MRGFLSIFCCCYVHLFVRKNPAAKKKGNFFVDFPLSRSMICVYYQCPAFLGLSICCLSFLFFFVVAFSSNYLLVWCLRLAYGYVGMHQQAGRACVCVCVSPVSKQEHKHIYFCADNFYFTHKVLCCWKNKHVFFIKSRRNL